MRGLSRAHKAASPLPNGRWNLKGIIKIFAVFLLFVLFVFAVIKLTVVPKVPATSEQMWSILIEQGYEPQDISDFYYNRDKDFKKVLNKCIAIEKKDIHFEFFDFNNENTPIEIYRQAHSDIIKNYNSAYGVEIEHRTANYILYTLDSLGSYSVAIYVGNTAVIAHCNSESQYEINKILDAIDYLEP